MNGTGFALEVRALRKDFGGLRVIDDVSFVVRPGEIVALVGPNGSGKTTTLDLIGGELRPEGGSIAFGGHAVTKLSVDERAERGLARTFQHGRVFGNMSVRENIVAGAFTRLRAARPLATLRTNGLGQWMALLAELAVAIVGPRGVAAETRRIESESEAEIERFGARLGPRMEQRAFLFSYANRRRIEIARALNARPALLLLDEPAAGMNPAETAELGAQLAALRADGHTMLIVEHKLELVRALADRVIVLDGGTKIFDGSPEAFQTDPAVLEAYVGRPADAARAPASAEGAGRALLVLDGIAAAYGAVPALTDVSLSVGEGEIVSLLGGNASGKSTTMKIVLGLLTPVSGRILFDEREVTQTRTPQRIRLGIASVPEARRIFSALTVEENLRVGAFVRRSEPIGDDLTRVFDLFPRLAERRTQAGGSLSGGEQQMLAIGRALMSRPRLLCLDEPTMGLAPRFVERVLDALVSINATGTSVLMVEQNVGLALQIARRGYVLANGSVVASGPAAALLGAAAVRDAYLGMPRAEPDEH